MTRSADLCSFLPMSATEAPAAPKPTRAGRLLGLVRQLIDYGRQLATTLRLNPPSFNAGDIALILARITRGLLRAEALEARVIRDTARLDAEPAPPRAPSHRRSPPARAPAAASEALVPGLTRRSACPRPSRSPPRSAVARSAPSSPTFAATSESCRAIRCGRSCGTSSFAMAATWPIW